MPPHQDEEGGAEDCEPPVAAGGPPLAQVKADVGETPSVALARVCECEGPPPEFLLLEGEYRGVLEEEQEATDYRQYLPELDCHPPLHEVKVAVEELGVGPEGVEAKVGDLPPPPAERREAVEEVRRLRREAVLQRPEPLRKV